MNIVGDDWVPSANFKISKDEAIKHLKSNYTNSAHPLAFMGVDKIYKFYNGVLSKNYIQSFLASEEVYSLIKQEKTNPQKKWTPVISFHYLDLGNINFMISFIAHDFIVQADLIDISSLSEANLGIKYLLCVIDCFSRLNSKMNTVSKFS